MKYLRYNSLGITAQASYWLDILNGRGDGDPPEPFSAWIDRSPTHQRALVSLMMTAGLVRSFAEEHREDVDRLVAAPAPLGRTPARRMAAPLGGLLIAVLAYWLFSLRTGWRDYPALVEHTYVLADQSKMRVAALSWARGRMTRDAREVRLVYGGAEFAVVHDPSRSFYVTSAPWVFRAVGTRFSVQKERDRSRIRVLEGEVSARQDGDDLVQWLVKEGYAMEMADSGAVFLIDQPPTAASTPVSARSPLSKRDVYGTVGEIAARLTRRNTVVQIEVTPAASSEGFFAAGVPDDAKHFVELLRKQPNLTVTLKEGRYIVDINAPR